jgi:succinate-acetate transporter protein
VGRLDHICYSSRVRELHTNDRFAAFTAYGSFWLSYATILIPGSGIAAEFAANPTQTHNALGLFLTSWFIFTFLMMCVRSPSITPPGSLISVRSQGGCAPA